MLQIPNFGFGAREEVKNSKEAEKKWRLNYLKDGLIKIQKRELDELSFEKLCVTTFEIVRDGKFSELLYGAVQDLIYNHVQIKSGGILRDLRANILSTLIKEWNHHIDSTKMIGGVLLFLEHAYVEREKLVNIYDMALTIFRKEIICNNEIRKHIKKILLEMVHTERTGNSISHNQFKEVINMLLSLSALDENNKIEYEEVFETEFLLQSEIFYMHVSQNMLSDISIGAISYIKNYEVRYNQEKERVARLLHSSTEKAILNILEKRLIKDRLTEIVDLNEGLKYMLERACKKELGIIYQWFKRYEREDEIVNMIIKIYKEYGLSIVEKEDELNKEHKIIENIVSLKDKYHEYLVSCFHNNEKLKKNIEDNFLLFFNQNPNMAEYLSSFMHETLRKKQKNITDEELEKKLDMFLKFFRLLSDKDKFERFYKNDLTKRLLTKPDLEIERKMISKFKAECGFVYTTQLEKMLTDIVISSHHMDIFHGEIIESNQSLAGIDFNVVVLNQGLWPIPSFPSCNLPAAPSVLLELYKTFYNDKHNGRIIKLQSNFGNALVEFNLNNNVKNEKMKLRSVFFDVSTLQMIILTLFNDRESISIEEICHLTNIPEKNVISSLNPIVNGKSMHRILKKSGDFQLNMPLKTDTVITVNDNFNSKISRIKIPFNSIQLDENSDRKLIQEKTELERGYEIDAAVVRIMKIRKKLLHRELVAEVIKALTRFRANVKAIDNRILRLIEKKYIEKINENGSDIYVYIA